MHRILAGAIALIVAALLAAPALGVETREEYAAEVNPICKRGAEVTKRKVKQIRPTGDPIADFIRQSVTFKKVFAKTIKRISKVDRPPADAKAARSWIRGLRRQKRLINRFIAAAKRRDGVQAVAIGKKVGKVQRKNANKAIRLDLNRCARQPKTG